MLENIEVICHNCIRFNKNNKVIYIDPFEIENFENDADIIFCTHSHYDHFSEKDILKIKKENTKIVITEDCLTKTRIMGFEEENIFIVEPEKKYNIDNLYFETVSAYNIGKNYHIKENGWVGYIIDIDGIKYYIAGDTDITPEAEKVVCDVAFLPVGGTYTMNFKEAASLANTIKPKYAIPTHYGKIIGTNEDAEKFKKLLNI